MLVYQGGSMSRIGKDIDAVCTKCKMLLNHIIVSELDGSVNKVQCRTCGSLHKYRDGSTKAVKVKKEQPARLIKAKSPTRAEVALLESRRLWQMRKEAMPADATIIDYHPDGDYKARKIVQHAKFGLGFVEHVISKTRIEILFQDGLKLMVMNTPLSS